MELPEAVGVWSTVPRQETPGGKFAKADSRAAEIETHHRPSCENFLFGKDGMEHGVDGRKPRAVGRRVIKSPALDSKGRLGGGLGLLVGSELIHLWSSPLLENKLRVAESVVPQAEENFETLRPVFLFRWHSFQAFAEQCGDHDVSALAKHGESGVELRG